MSHSFLSERGPSSRPPIVKAAAIACFALGIYLVANGALIAFGVLSLASGAYVLGEYSTMGPLLYFVVAGTLFLIGLGLMRRWNWSRRLAIIAAALVMATAVMPVSSAVIYFHLAGIVIHGVKIIAAIIAIRYLLQPEVVEWFRAA